MHPGPLFDMDSAERLPVAGVRDLEAASTFTDLKVGFVGAGSFVFGVAAPGDFDEPVGALVFFRRGEDVISAGGEHYFPRNGVHHLTYQPAKNDLPPGSRAPVARFQSPESPSKRNTTSPG